MSQQAFPVFCGVVAQNNLVIRNFKYDQYDQTANLKGTQKKDNNGSEFIIRIPLGKDHLKPEELIDEEEIKEKQNQELAEVEQLEQEMKETENVLVCGLRAEYRKAAMLGDMLYPVVTTEAEQITVTLADEKGAPYAIICFRIQKKERQS